MKHEVEVFVFMRQDAWDPKPYPQVVDFELEESETRVLVGKQTVAVEVPDDFDMRPAQIAALQRQKLDLQAELQQKLTQIDETIQRLLALEHTT